MPKFSPVVPRRRRISSSLAVLALAVLTAAGCDSSTGNDDSIASLSVNPETPVMHIGNVQQLVATPATSSGKILEGKTIAWSSSNPAVATVDGNGLVTALAGGTTTVSASVGGKSDDAAVTVWFPVQTVTLASTGGATTMCMEGSLALVPTYVDATGATVTGRQAAWTSEDPTIAEVTATGVIIGRDIGVTTITATSGTAQGTFVIDVNCQPIVDEVELRPTLGANMAVGMTDQFVATATAASGTVLDLTGRTVVWTSSDPAVATVDANGLVTLLTLGETDIDVSVDGVDANTVTVTGLPQALDGVGNNTGLIASGASVFYVIDVPAGTTQLEITLAGGSGGDPDIYAYRPVGSLGGQSFNSGPGEQIIVANPAVGRWVVEVNAWDGAPDHTGAVLTATVTP